MSAFSDFIKDASDKEVVQVYSEVLKGIEIRQNEIKQNFWMNLYTIDYWVPFPSSEYGGLIVVAAKDKEEAAEVAYSITSGFDVEEYTEDYLKQNIVYGAKHIGYTDMYSEATVIDGFVT